MNWTPQDAGELARYRCRDCDGTGLLPGTEFALCTCVCRRVFRACYHRFRVCAESDTAARSMVFKEMPKGVDRHLVWFRRNEDYCADFQSAARRVLSRDLYRTFRIYYVLGAAIDLVARQFRVSRTEVYRQVTEIEALVGRELALLQPYSLYPPREYMKTTANHAA